LTWDKIDLKSGKISIEKAVTLDYRYDKKGKLESIESIIAKTKTEKSKRIVVIDDITIGLLKRWQAWASIKTKTDMSPEGFVFGNTSSTLISF
jgi:integrase